MAKAHNPGHSGHTSIRPAAAAYSTRRKAVAADSGRGERRVRSAADGVGPTLSASQWDPGGLWRDHKWASRDGME